MKIFELETNTLKPYDKNAKMHDQKQIDNVAESIKKYGFKQPLVVDKDRVVIIGHCRLLASKKLGLEKVPCVIADDLSEEQVKALRLIDNKTNESEWDFELLRLDLEGLDLEGFNIDWELPEEKHKIEEDNFDIDMAMSQDDYSQEGDIYILGNHKLMCGDSTNQEDVETLMDGEKADLLFTDPPYNVNVSNSEGMTIKNDNMDTNSFREFLHSAFKCASSVLKRGGGHSMYGTLILKQ